MKNGVPLNFEEILKERASIGEKLFERDKGHQSDEDVLNLVKKALSGQINISLQIKCCRVDIHFE